MTTATLTISERKPPMERLVWLKNSDFALITRAVNLAVMMADEAVRTGMQFHDLDGDPIPLDTLLEGAQAIDKAQDALMRSKYVPEGLDTLRVVLMSD